MVFEPRAAMYLFIAVALFSLATVLLAAGRRRPEGVTLAVFLGLVGANFLTNAIFFITGDTRWDLASYVALALDPLYLVAFVTLYPYRRRPPAVLALFIVMSGLAAAGVVLAVVGATPRGPFSPVLPPVPAVLGLVLGYIAAWLLTIANTLHAPTPQLARRSTWAVAAVGVAVVPRMTLVSSDLGYPLSQLFLTWGIQLKSASDLAVFLDVLFAVTVFAGGYLMWRHSPRRASCDLAPAFRLVGALSALLIGFYLLEIIGQRAGFTQFQGSVLYGLRWVVFSFLLVYGMLAYELVDFPRSGRRVVQSLGALLGGTAGFLGTFAWILGQGVPPTLAAPIGLAVGLGAAVPSGVVARAGAEALERAHGPGEATERRLALYQAAAEAAWARGAPDRTARRQLEQDRRAFGVSEQEARALEHAVAARVDAGRRPGLAPGVEPVPGLLVGELLGEGAHGRVFAAVRHPGGERVVVKELRPGPEGTPGQAQLLNELRALQRLDHPRIARLLEVQAARGRPLLVLQRVPGRPLSEELTMGPMPQARVLAMVADLLDALDAAHRQGVIHRDVKPSNILVSEGGRAWLTDFGIAVLEPKRSDVRATVTNLDAVGAHAGTLAYMAPEQVGGGPIGPATDLYALGLVLYEALCGKPALDLRGAGVYAAVDRVARPRIDLKAAPEAWQPFLARALAREPSQRFPSAVAMRAALPAATLQA